MPFIKGHYYMNPVVGEAIEAAREAEAALLALQETARQNAGQNDNDDASSGGQGTAANENQDDDEDRDANAGSDTANGPIHRVEIDAAELVPSHTGRAERGFVARVHRNVSSSKSSARPGIASPPETHVFAGHQDLMSFLRDAFAKDANQRHA